MHNVLRGGARLKGGVDAGHLHRFISQAAGRFTNPGQKAAEILCGSRGTEGAVKNRQSAGTVAAKLEIEEGGVGDEGAEAKAEPAEIQFGEANRGKRRGRGG